MIVLLSEGDLGGQLLCFIRLAQLREHIDLLHGNWQQLGLPLFLAEVRESIAQVLGALQTHLGLAKFIARDAAACCVEGSLEDVEVLACGLLLLGKLALACPLELCIDGARIDADIVLFGLHVLVGEVPVDLGGVREVL